MSSLGGSISFGNRSRSAATAWLFSSTDNVVCESQATFAGSRPRPARLSGPSTSRSSPRLPGSTDNLFVPFVPDQQNVVVLRREAPGFVVDLGDERTCGVDRLKARSCASPAHSGAIPCAENTTTAPSGISSFFFDEHRAALLKRPHAVLVVHDLLADVHRGAEPLQRHLDRLDSAINSSAVTAGLREQDTSGRHGHDTHGR